MKQKDEEIERLEGEVAGYRDDIDNMFTLLPKEGARTPPRDGDSGKQKSGKLQRIISSRHG